MSKERPLCFITCGNLGSEREKKLTRLGSLIICAVYAFFVTSATANDIQITEKTNPKIVELYNQLQEKQNQISELETERGDALQKNLDAMRENEQRLENRMLGATTTLATGLGGMTAASAYAEQRADADALNAMRAYLATFRCDYGGGRVVDYGPNDVDLPGGNELIEYTNEYKSLAENLKKTKAALGLVPGIESETILSRAETGLYDNVSTGKTTGAYASLARGILDPDGADAAEIAQQQSETAEKLKVGAVALGAGVIGGAIENYRLNKDAPKEQSEQINAEYDSKVETLTQEQESIEKDLDNAIAENARAVQEYNKNVAEHRKNIDEIERAPADCRNLFGEYTAAVAGLELIENEMDSVPDVTLPEMDSDLLAKCTQCKNKDAIFYAETKTCECPDDRPIEKDGKCVEKPVEVAPMVPDPETPVYDKIVPEEKEEKDDPADYCPAKGNALKSITDKNKVGDSCTSDIISQGTITKRKNGTCTCDATGCWSPYTPNKSGQCVKQQSGGASSGTKKTNEFVDENGYCKPYKIKEWFFNKEQSADISKKFQKLCDDAAKAHNCKRKDLNTSRLIEKDDSGAVQYEWTCNADSEDYLATQERINQRHANLSYENVCKKLKPGTTNQEGQIKRGCFGIFENIDIPDYKTQLELAKARIGTSSACSDKREIRRNKSTNNPIGYYTNCNTTNDKERYTFIFTGISSGNTTPENLMRAACATYGVKFGAQGGELGRKQPYCSYKYTGENDPTCAKIDTLAQKFGYNARIVRGTGCVLDTTGTVGGEQLAKSGMRSDEKIRNLRTAFDIDNTMFANISTNMDEWLYDQMRINIANEMKRAGHSDPLVKFECFPAKSFALDKGVEFKLFGNTSGRNVLTCQANGHDIDFVFSQLGHSTKRRAKASQEGLTCIFGSNGKYDGRQCWGIKEEDCNKLDAEIKLHAKNCSQCGARWDDGIGGCVLTKSTKVEKTNKGLEIAGNIALIAGGAVITVMSGGMAMPMLVTELALMGVEITGATVAAVEEKHMRNVANEFLAKTQYCHDAECAQKLLTDKDVHRILNLESNLDERQSKIIDDKLSELLGVVPSDAPLYVALLAGMENKPNCNFWRNATAQCEWAQFWHTWANVAQFASLGAALGRSAVRFVNAKLAIEKAATTLAREITPAQAKKIGELDKKIAVLESKANRTSKEAAELKKLHQERNTLLNKIGTKDADEVARLQKAALDKKAIEDAQAEYRSALKKRNEMADYMAKHNGNPPQGKTRFDVKDINDEVAKAEKKLKDLGQEVTPAEPLQIGKKPTTTPEPKPVEPTTTPKEPETTTPKTEEPATPKPAEVEAKPTAVPATPQSAVRAKLGDKVNADIEGIKSGKTKELHIPKGQLTDDEWKILKDDLAKDGLEITDAPGNMYYVVKKSGNVDDVARATPRAIPKVRSIEEIENSLGDGYKNLKPELRTNPERTLVFSKNSLTSAEWETLNKSLAKDNLEVVPSGNVMFMRQKRVYPDAISDIRSRVYSEFNTHADNIKKGVERELHIPKEHLSDEEWKVLEADLNKEGLEITEANSHYYTVRKAQTSGNVPTVPRTIPKVDNSIDALKTKASSNFDNYLQSCASGGACNGLPVNRLTKEEWQQLNQYAKSRGVELYETQMFNKNTGTYDDVMRFRSLNSTNDVVGGAAPKTTPTTNPGSTPKAPAPVVPKRTPAQEEAQWRMLYEKYAPENQTFDNFKKSFGNNLTEAEESAKNWDLNVAETLNLTEAKNTSYKLWTDFNNKYGTQGDKYPYGKYANIRDQGISADEYLEIRKKGISTDEYLADKLGWSKEQIEDANKVYMAQKDVRIALNSKLPVGKGDAYSTFDSDIAALRRELQDNLTSSTYADIEPFFNKGNLTIEEYNNLVDYVSHRTYDEQILIGAFNKEPGLNGVAAKAYDNFLAAKSENVRKISDVAGVSRKSLTGPQVARNKFVQDFVSKRVTLYEDIITKNPNIYNSAKRWNQLSIEEKEKLCKEIFEIADNKLMIQHTDFSVKDLVAMGYQPTAEGLQLNGNVYLSSRHFPDMSFKYVMRKIAHEQAHKVDTLNPNRGILGSQLADLGSKEGYIQGFTGYDYADYRRELTEQSSWLIDEALEEALSKLGF